MIAKTKIDVHERSLSMEFCDNVHFNIFEAVRHLAEEHFVFLVDIIDDAIDSVDICTNLFSYFGIFFMASNRGILTSTLLKVSRRSKSSTIFFAGMDLEGKGKGIYFVAEFLLAL